MNLKTGTAVIGALAFSLGLATTSLNAITIDLAGNGGLANSYSFTNVGGVAGLNLTVQAFTKQSAGSGSFLSAKVGQYSPGLGVTNDGANSPGGSPYSDSDHEVDNIGYLDFLLFTFTSPVKLTEVRLDFIGSDSDFQLWIGNSSTPGTLFGGTVQTTDGNNGGSDDSSTYSVNSLNLAGTNILLGASTLSDNDTFKVRKLTFDVTTNTPGVPDSGSSVLMLGAALVGLGFLARRKVA